MPSRQCDMVVATKCWSTLDAKRGSEVYDLVRPAAEQQICRALTRLLAGKRQMMQCETHSPTATTSMHFEEASIPWLERIFNL